MALVKPIVNDVAAFDKSVGTTITFTANGGDLIVGNQVYIVTNPSNPSETEKVAYNHQVTSFELSHVIPPNASATVALTNGTYYKVRIRTYDALGNYSEWSDYVPFYCYSTPTLTLNVSSGQTISTAVFNFNLTYTQAQSELVNYAKINLYKSNGALISSSGNLYPPTTGAITFNYKVNNLQNNTNYKVKAVLETINGTVCETNLIPFTVSYTELPNENELIATVDSCEGYINVRSSIISRLIAESHPDPLTYINDDTMADMINTVTDINIPNYATWARWRELEVPTNFLLRAWFYPSRQPFEVIRLTNSEYGDLNSATVYLTVTFNRSSTTDYLSIRTNNGTVIDLPLNVFCNGHTKVFLWVNVVGNTWDARVAILETEPTILDWTDAPNSAESNTNIPYNITTDIVWGGEAYGTFTPSTSVYNTITGQITTVMAGNGIFDEINISTDTSLPYTTDQPIMTPQTLLKVDFNGTIGSDSNITRLLLKRRDDTLSDWINLVDINNITYGQPVYINFNDSFVPTGIEQTYGLVTYVNNVPTETYTITVTPVWGKYYISDKTHNFPLNYAVIYSNHSQNIQNGVFLPIGAKYPIVVQNAKGNYRSGSLQFKCLGYQYEIDKRLNRQSIVQQTDDIVEFLTNGKAKCIKDFNGNIFIVKVINSPQISYDANWGNGVTTISFDWVEQTKYNDSEGMVDVGLFDYVAAE